MIDTVASDIAENDQRHLPITVALACAKGAADGQIAVNDDDLGGARKSPSIVRLPRCTVAVA